MGLRLGAERTVCVCVRKSDSPQEALVQMSRRHREYVQDVLFLLLCVLLLGSSACDAANETIICEPVEFGSEPGHDYHASVRTASGTHTMQHWMEMR